MLPANRLFLSQNNELKMQENHWNILYIFIISAYHEQKHKLCITIRSHHYYSESIVDLMPSRMFAFIIQSFAFGIFVCYAGFCCIYSNCITNVLLRISIMQRILHAGSSSRGFSQESELVPYKSYIIIKRIIYWNVPKKPLKNLHHCTWSTFPASIIFNTTIKLKKGFQ